MLRFLILALIPALAYGIEFTPCGGENPPITVTVVDCDTAPCPIENGEIISFTVTFVVPSSSATADLEVYGTFLGETHPIDIPPALSDACAAGLSCPVTAGATTTYNGNIPIETELQGGIPITLQFRIIGSDSTLVCFSAQATIY